MRIGVNLLYMIPGVVGGTETYAVSLLRALDRLGGANEYLLFINRESRDFDWCLGRAFEVVRTDVPASSRVTRYAWEQAMFFGAARRNRLDLVHSMGYVAPLRLPCPSVVTIHDLNYRAIPDSFSPIRRRTLAFLVPRVARRSACVLTGSEFSRRAIISNLGVAAHRVIVTPYAAKPRLTASPAVFEGLARRHGIRSGFVFALSSQSAHKNIAGLIEAFSRLDPTLAPQLVLAGHPPADGGRAFESVTRAGEGGRIIFTGFLSDAELSTLFEKSACFVFPSLYEGFGLPVLEAMAAGAPVVSSHAASLPEVVGEAGLLVDPRSPSSIAEAIRKVLQDDRLRTDLRERGRLRAADFSWERSAERTLDAYTFAASGATGR